MQTKTTVVNKYHGEPFDVYIGRGSKWGNPFTHKQGTQAQFIMGSREEAVQAYREWIQTQPHLLADLHELKGKVLQCYCAPKACHGHVLAELADALPETKTPSVVRIGFTGHRPKKLGGYNLNTVEYKQLQADLEQYIERNLAAYDTVIGHSCLALGGDTVWSKAILAMREKYPNRVHLHAEIPMMEMAEAWYKQQDVDFFHAQIEQASESTVYGSLIEYTDKAKRRSMAIKFMDDGSKGMIDHVDMLLALCDGSKSGTQNAVDYANERNTHTFVVHPTVYFG